jgi:hypothetical protein
MARWHVGTLARWRVGALARWNVGAMARWRDGAFLRSIARVVFECLVTHLWGCYSDESSSGCYACTPSQVECHPSLTGGLERLPRYCARPAFASNRLARIDDQQLIYKLSVRWRQFVRPNALAELSLERVAAHRSIACRPRVRFFYLSPSKFVHSLCPPSMNRSKVSAEALWELGFWRARPICG